MYVITWWSNILKPLNKYKSTWHWGLGIQIFRIPWSPFGDWISEQILTKLVWILRPPPHPCSDTKVSDLDNSYPNSDIKFPLYWFVIPVFTNLFWFVVPFLSFWQYCGTPNWNLLVNTSQVNELAAPLELSVAPKGSIQTSLDNKTSV